MSLTAKYEANFEAFYAAVGKAEVSLTQWEKSGAQVDAQMNRIANSLTGAKVTQDAIAMANVIEKLGGTAHLTEKELAKVSKTAAEAGAKMRAMGQDVPANIQALADEAETLPPLFSTIGKAAAAMFTVGMVKDFMAAIIALGGEIKTLSEQTSVTYGEMQQLMHIAAQTGTPIESLTKGIQTLQNSLASGDQSAINAMARLGVSMEDFKKADPHKQLLMVSEALRGVGDAGQFARNASDLFGGSWRTMAPALKADMEKIGASAWTMSNEAVDGIDYLSSSFSSLGSAAMVAGGEVVGAFGNWLKSGDFENMADDVKQLEEAIKRLPPAWDFAARAGDGVKLSQDELNKILAESNAALAESIAKNKAWADAEKEVLAAGTSWIETVGGMNAATVEQTKALLEAGLQQKTVATYLNLTAVEVRAVSEALKAEERAIAATNKLWGEYNAIVVSQTGTATDAAIADIERWASQTAKAMEDAGAATAEFYEALAEVTHAKMNDVLIDWQAIGDQSQVTYARNLEQIAQKAEATFQYAIDHAEQFSVATLQSFGEAAQAAREAANNWRSSWVEAGDEALEAVEKTTAGAVTAFKSMQEGLSKNAPGKVDINLGNMAFGPGGLEAAMKAYTARYSASSVGAIGGGPAGDFLSFAKSMGYAMPSFPQTGGGGAVISNTFNVVDTEAEIARRVSEEISRQIQRGSLVQ